MKKNTCLNLIMICCFCLPLMFMVTDCNKPIENLPTTAEPETSPLSDAKMAADKAIAKREWDKAQEIYERILKANPDDIDALYNLAVILEHHAVASVLDRLSEVVQIRATHRLDEAGKGGLLLPGRP